MSHLSSLKVYAATYVAESNDLSREDKVWLIDFIKEGEHKDVMNILEGEYQLPQITEYEAEMLNTYILEAKPPPIVKKNKPKTKVKIMPDLGIASAAKERKKWKKTETAAREIMPDATKKSVKGAKHFAKPYRRTYLKAAGKSATKVGTVAGGIALAAAGGHSLYQKYMSKAAQACKGKSNKEVCMATFRKKAKAGKNIHKIKVLRVSKSDCINARNPVLCRRRIDAKIKRLKEDVNLFVEDKAVDLNELMGPLGIAFDVLFVFELGGMAYKRLFSKAAKACKGSVDRRLCVLRYKVKAKEAQMRTISSKAGLCKRDKDPAKCKSKIGRKLQSLKSDIVMLRQELG